MKNTHKARYAVAYLTWDMLTCQFSLTHVSVDQLVFYVMTSAKMNPTFLAQKQMSIPQILTPTNNT